MFKDTRKVGLAKVYPGAFRKLPCVTGSLWSGIRKPAARKRRITRFRRESAPSNVSTVIGTRRRSMMTGMEGKSRRSEGFCAVSVGEEGGVARSQKLKAAAGIVT